MTTIVRNEDPWHPVLREQVLLRAHAFASLGYESAVLVCGVDSHQPTADRPDELASVELRLVPSRGLPAFARATRSAARNADVLVCRGATPTVVALAARRLQLRRSPRVVYDARGWIYGERLDKGDGPLAARLKGAVERYAFRHADRVVAPAQSLLGIAAAAGAAPERLTLIPQLASLGPGAADDPERTVDVVYVGTEQAVYQPHDEIRDLLTRLADELPELELEWLDGNAGAEVERVRANLVRFCLPPSEVEERLRRARVGLIIRAASRTNLAAAPTKAAQYIAAGCRVVSGPDPPAVAEWAMTGGGALVIDPDRCESWAAAIRAAIDSPRSPALDLAAVRSLWDRALAG